jgi:hypothetical protein
MTTGLKRWWRAREVEVIACVFLAGAGAVLAQTTGSAPAIGGPKSKSWFDRHFGRPAWEEVKRAATTPREICRFVGTYISYRTEDVDRWTSPDETWARGKGDCEDFATLVEQACHDAGFDACIELYFPAGRPGQGHAIAVGHWQGRMWMSDTGDYREVRSVEEVLECDAAEMWTVRLDHDGIERTLNRHAGRTAAPVARSGR